MTTRQRITYGLLVAAGTVSLGAFLWWWFQPGHLPHNFHGPLHIVDGLLFGLLTLVILHRPFMDVFTWIVSWTIEKIEHAPVPQDGLRVAFITTFVPGSEPIDLLYRTLPAMVGADYPHDTWVLDEGGDPEVERVCRELGAHYFSRAGVRRYNLVVGPYTAKTKGGNHNAWYDSHGHSYDIVAQIDTDFLPRQDFLMRTLGFFRDEKVGWVGTPQVYGNGADSIVAKGAAQQLFMFYGAIMRGLSGRESANMIGANHIVRVAALQQIDFYAGHLTEDLLTGMQLHAKGWTSRYISTPLAIGEGPVTWQAFFSQQMRWAHGCMDILFHHSPGLFRKMGRRQAAVYGALQQHYFGGIAMAMGVGLLVTYFFAGLYAANVTIVGVVLWAGPQFVVRQGILFWLQRFSPSPETDRGLHLAGRLVSILVWPIYFLAAVGVFRGKRLGFKVTPKGNLQDVRWIPPSVTRAHAVIGGISAACLVAGFVFDRLSIPLLAWATLNAVSMLGFVGYVAVNNTLLRIRTARAAPRHGALRFFPSRTTSPELRTIPELVADHRALAEVGGGAGAVVGVVTAAEARVAS